MVESRQRSDWWHTASLLASIQNLFASKGNKVSVKDCHPMETGKAKVTLKGKQLSILKDIFCRPEKK